MPQTKTQQATAALVAAWMARHEKNKAWLIEEAGIDRGTVDDFLNGSRWVQTRTQGKIEKALGWPSGTIRQISKGAPYVEEELLATEPSPSPLLSLVPAVAPLSEDLMESMSGRIEGDEDGRLTTVVESVSSLNGSPTRLEIRYWPGQDQWLSVSDLTGIAGDAHRAAHRATRHDAFAARTGQSAGRAAREDQNEAGQENQDPGGMEPS